jgi:CDP-paratose 2-epimerase
MSSTLITGGAGFIGSNLANALLAAGHPVTIFDSLVRPGTEQNLQWLRQLYPETLSFIMADVRDADAVAAASNEVDIIYHLAGQVAVTSSVENPRIDFEVNALGSFNVLESARASGRRPIVVFTSTNKVYGGMEDVEIVRQKTRYSYRDLPGGIAESRALDFHSPYGCSKGAADQYVRDYARIYGLPTVVFRMSCIYGPRQFGNEDQGWLAHFMIAASSGQPITIYGDGLQVRDALYVGDLVRAFRMAVDHIDTTAGNVYNIGGGPTNTISVWSEFGPVLVELLGAKPDVRFEQWRPGDQMCYVSDISKAARAFGWAPDIGLSRGLRHLWAWVTAQDGPGGKLTGSPVPGAVAAP